MFKAFIIGMATFLLLLCTAHAATIYVPDNYTTIQAAIDASANGDTIIVRPGTYVENIDFLGKAITLKSEQGAAVTTIDGNQAGSVVTFETGETPAAHLVGFTLSNGNGSGGPAHGGGIFCINSSSPTITYNTIMGNSGMWGGGIYCANSSPTITNNTISWNGGLFAGGGIFCFSASPILDNNIISDNTAIDGGGIRCYDASSPNITNNIITGNEAYDFPFYGDGAGINCSGSSPTIANNTICGNHAASSGGGIFCDQSSPLITNNTISINIARLGGGIYCDVNSSPTIANTILWDNDAISGQGSEIWIGDWYGPSTVTISYSDVDGGLSSVHVDSGSTLNWGPDMIDADPRFVDSANDDYHLKWHSPCRDTGDNSVVTEQFDFEGDPRIADGTVDMGADEYYYHLYLTGDPFPGESVTFNVVGDPGTTPVKVYRGSLRTTPLSTQYGLLYIKKPFPHIWSIGPVPANGIATTTKTIPSGVNPGAAFYFQALHGPVGNSNTKLTNLLTLTVE